MAEELVLAVDDLTVDYLRDSGRVRAVDGVSFQVAPREVFGLVGESGSGKSTLALALLRLLLPPAVISRRPRPAGRPRSARPVGPGPAGVAGRQASLVPQSGMNALNPLLTITRQIVDAIRVHEPVARPVAHDRARQLCAQVGLSPAAADGYTHELSGGMRQRAVIAMALALRPALLILDEPTAALDVILQRDILAQILGLQASLGFAVLFISHDLALTLALCARVGVLHQGKLVETAPARGSCTSSDTPTRAPCSAPSRRAPDRRPSDCRTRRRRPCSRCAAWARPSCPAGADGRAGCGRWTTSRSICGPGRRSPWWANPARARARSSG